jgi:ElaB/YqjD/DUF883 family membrane-anchored ribosome-binding protein
MENPVKPATVQPPPRFPGLTRRMIRAHAARLFRDVFSTQRLTVREWRLVEKDLARKLEHDGFWNAPGGPNEGTPTGLATCSTGDSRCRNWFSETKKNQLQPKKKKHTMESNYEAIENAQGEIARERVRADLENLTQNAEDLLKTTAGDVSEKTKEVRSRVAAALESAKATCVRLQAQSVATAKEAAKKTDAVIREHPYESIGVAFGLGVLIGVLVIRK